MNKVSDVIEALQDIQEEEGVSKILATKIQEMIDTLQDSISLELRVDRVRSILDEIEEHNNIPNYLRTQLWNVAAMLEFM